MVVVNVFTGFLFFSHGRTYSRLTTVLPALAALNLNTNVPPTPTMSTGAFDASAAACPFDGGQANSEDDRRVAGASKGQAAMIDDWFSTIKLPLTIEQFRQLPRNPAYKYEYFDGHAWLSPRPHSYYAILDLQTFARPAGGIASHEKLVIRPLQEADWPQLPELLAAAFHRVQPFASLTDDDRLKAAEDCLGHTRAGGDGSFVDDACMVAARDDGPVGAILITLPPDPHLKSQSGCRT